MTARRFVAYERDGDAPHYLRIPEDDVSEDVSTAEGRAGFFESMRLEGAIAARIEDDDGIGEQLFVKDGSLPVVYMVTAAECDGRPPYTATVAELRKMFPDREFIETTAGVVVVDEGGARYVGLVVAEYRRRRASTDIPVSIPIVREGEPWPEDRTGVYVSVPRRTYRHDVDEATGRRRLLVVGRTVDVIPYVDGKPLWSLVVIDQFSELGELRAIEAARQAIELARGIWSYDATEHYRSIERGKG